MPATNLEEHATLVDRLGGPKAVAEAVAAKTGKSITPQAVSNWRTKHGVAWPYRALIAEMAKKKRVKLPKNFLTPGH